MRNKDALTTLKDLNSHLTRVLLTEKIASICKLAASPPNYRSADPTERDTRCGTCEYYEDGSSICTKFDTKVSENYVCDAFEPNVERIKAVTKRNIDRPDLLSKISAVLSQAQAPMPPGGGMPPPPPGGGMDPLAAILGGGGMPPGGGGMPPMPPGGGMPPPPPAISPMPGDMGGLPPLPPLPPPGDEGGETSPSKEEGEKKEEKSDTDEKLDMVLSKLDDVVTQLKRLVDSLGGSTESLSGKPEEPGPEERKEVPLAAQGRGERPPGEVKTSAANLLTEDQLVKEILNILNS